jgi:hypothetical protein
MNILKLMRRIRHGIVWRWYHLVAALHPHGNRACLEYRWRFQRAGRRHALPKPLIVSLTSYPARYGVLPLTLRSILRQTVKPDRVVLWIAEKDLSSLTPEITGLQTEGLDIRPTDDLRSYKKIIPALDAFPDAFICTADDDLYYWSTWLEELVEGIIGPERTITCHRAHEIAADALGHFKSYDQWVIDTRLRGNHRNLFPTGSGGILYPPGILAHGPEDRQAILDLCPYSDDIWLYWMGRRNGANYRAVSRRRDLAAWPGSQTEGQGLWRYNLGQGGNDVQIRKMAEKYGYPDVRGG